MAKYVSYRRSLQKWLRFKDPHVSSKDTVNCTTLLMLLIHFLNVLVWCDVVGNVTYVGHARSRVVQSV